VAPTPLLAKKGKAFTCHTERRKTNRWGKEEVELFPTTEKSIVLFTNFLFMSALVLSVLFKFVHRVK
jgi:hypothetical protein